LIADFIHIELFHWITFNHPTLIHIKLLSMLNNIYRLLPENIKSLFFYFKFFLTFLINNFLFLYILALIIFINMRNQNFFKFGWFNKILCLIIFMIQNHSSISSWNYLTKWFCLVYITFIFLLKFNGCTLLYIIIIKYLFLLLFLN
jgi:hypothetical protein